MQYLTSMIAKAGTNGTKSDYPWFRSRVPDGYWDQRPNRLIYMTWLGARLGFSDTDDWYRLQNRHFDQNRGKSLLRHIYRSSVLTAMHDYLPEVDWIPWLFSKTPGGYWSICENRKAYMSWLEQKLNISQSEDWYTVDELAFNDHSGSGLLTNFFHGSVLAALREHRPDVDWKPWLFRKVPNGFWKDGANRREYYDWLGNRNGYQSVEDWSRLTRSNVRNSRGSALLEGYFRGSVARLIADIKLLVAEST